MRKLIGCCGLDCERCDVYVATIQNNDALREKTAKLWSGLNHIQITPDMLHCLGCRADGVKTRYCSDLCQIRKCVQGKGLQTCGACSEIERCGTVGAIHRNRPEARHNLLG